MGRTTQRIDLPSSSIGTKYSLQVHHYGPKTPNISTKRAYIQSSLHADEIPGLLVSHHLIHLLDAADKLGHITEEIDIVPYANPIGLNQNLLGNHLGRFSLDSGVNFNRDYMDISSAVGEKVQDKLSQDGVKNVKIIREEMLAQIDSKKIYKEEAVLKKILFKMACVCDIVLDLHCDSDAVLHMYTHERLWPNLSDLAAEIGSECHLISPAAGGEPFDEACSCPWAALADKFPSFPIPMACESATVELRWEIWNIYM